MALPVSLLPATAISQGLARSGAVLRAGDRVVIEAPLGVYGADRPQASPKPLVTHLLFVAGAVSQAPTLCLETGRLLALFILPQSQVRQARL